jgi:hypothetical protein
MGWISMSERDLKRIEVLAEVLAGRRTVVSAARVLALGVRQTFRLLARYKDGGGGVWTSAMRCCDEFFMGIVSL